MTPELFHELCRSQEAHHPADALELPDHLPCLVLSWRPGRCVGHADAQAAGRDAGGAGAPVRRSLGASWQLPASAARRPPLAPS